VNPARADDRGQKTEVSGQRSQGPKKKPKANDQRPEIEGLKKEETGETPGSEAAAALNKVFATPVQNSTS